MEGTTALPSSTAQRSKGCTYLVAGLQQCRDRRGQRQGAPLYKDIFCVLRLVAGAAMRCRSDAIQSSGSTEPQATRLPAASRAPLCCCVHGLSHGLALRSEWHGVRTAKRRILRSSWQCHGTLQAGRSTRGRGASRTCRSTAIPTLARQTISRATIPMRWGARTRVRLIDRIESGAVQCGAAARDASAQHFRLGLRIGCRCRTPRNRRLELLRHSAFGYLRGTLGY